MNNIIKFNFHGDQLDLVREGDDLHVSIRRVCENLGVSTQGQLAKLQNDESTCIKMILTQLPGDTQGREIACIHLKSLTLWVATIHPNKVKPEVREKLIAYKRECQDVLYAHFFGGPQPVDGNIAAQVVAGLTPVLSTLTTVVAAGFQGMAYRMGGLEQRMDALETKASAAGISEGIGHKLARERILNRFKAIALIETGTSRGREFQSVRSRIDYDTRQAAKWNGRSHKWEKLPPTMFAETSTFLDALEKDAKSKAAERAQQLLFRH